MNLHSKKYSEAENFTEKSSGARIFTLEENFMVQNFCQNILEPKISLKSTRKKNCRAAEVPNQKSLGRKLSQKYFRSQKFGI